MSDAAKSDGLSDAELSAESGTALPDKEVVSILDLNADLNVALHVAAPVDLAVAANANAAAPIDASASANVLSAGSTSGALSDQGAAIHQGITGDATAASTQDSTIGATDPGTTDPGTTDPGTTDPGTTDPGTPVPPTDGTSIPPVPTGTDGNLLNVNVNLDADAGVTAPINGAVAANANVAEPINAAVSANIGSIGSDSVAVAQQTAIIDQQIDGDATANAGQSSDITNP